MYIEKINNANDIKNIDKKNLPALAAEIRRFLVENISKTGGHLASNLGAVELTMALHYCLDLDKDKIVWDVGHQAYVHKILTGRRKDFPTLRTLDGLCGFPKPSESKYDSFAAGHSSTSISAAFGMAVARDIMGTDEKIFAVIGDGSFTGGMVYEAMNNAGRSGKDIVVILNDNQMSISNNVGAVSRHLIDLRTQSAYLNAKENVHKILDKIPVVGNPIAKSISTVKDGVKRVFASGVLFEELGFNYIGQIDGHNINELIEVISNINKMHGPILLHVRTIKGKGYPFAEKYPSKFHGIGKFDIKTGKTMPKGNVKSYSSVFGDFIAEEGENDKHITAVTAAMAEGTGLEKFSAACPDRVFDVGIAEQHAVTFCAGMASMGMKPVFAVYSTFLQRGYDQIIHDVCMQKLHVLFAIDRAGIVGADGETHQGVFDISYLSAMPNITVMAPRSGAELKAMLKTAINAEGAVAVRYPRANIPDYGFENIPEIELGKAELIKDGKDIAFLSCGTMFETVLNVCKKLENDGFNPVLYNARFVKPMDTEMIKHVCGKCKYIFTVEDGIKNGGFGSLVMEEAENQNYTGHIHSFAFDDKFIEHGTREQIFERYGLDSEGIYKTAVSIINEEGI